jgi:hypothetical protein
MAGTEKIVSGGQTGADRAALDFRIEHGIPHGGYCAANRGRISKRQAACYSANRERIADYQAAYRVANRGRL